MKEKMKIWMTYTTTEAMKCKIDSKVVDRNQLKAIRDR